LHDGEKFGTEFLTPKHSPFIAFNSPVIDRLAVDTVNPVLLPDFLCSFLKVRMLNKALFVEPGISYCK